MYHLPILTPDEPKTSAPTNALVSDESPSQTPTPYSTTPSSHLRFSSGTLLSSSPCKINIGGMTISRMSLFRLAATLSSRGGLLERFIIMTWSVFQGGALQI